MNIKVRVGNLCFVNTENGVVATGRMYPKACEGGGQAGLRLGVVMWQRLFAVGSAVRQLLRWASVLL